MAEARRRLEDTVAAARSLGNEFTLDLVLVRENEYRPRLLAVEDGRVRVLPPVPLAATAVRRQPIRRRVGWSSVVHDRLSVEVRRVQPVLSVDQSRL